MIDFKLGQHFFFFVQKIEWLSHPRLNGFTQQRKKMGRGRKSRSVVDMDKWDTAEQHTTVTQIGPESKLEHTYEYNII